MLPFGAQTTRWISAKIGMDLPRDPVEVTPRGGIILEKLKKLETFHYWSE